MPFDVRRGAALVWGVALGLSLFGLSGCQTPPPPAAPPVVEAPPERMAAPGEASLARGVEAYRNADYKEAEMRFKQALQLGLNMGPDQAAAHKHLAFIYCTSRREALCAKAFQQARQADPAFALSKSEVGHPLWGKVYRKALGLR
jgi:Tfp pilus assembly protein PilF